jgi:hypothetical protein
VCLCEGNSISTCTVQDIAATVIVGCVGMILAGRYVLTDYLQRGRK